MQITQINGYSFEGRTEISLTVQSDAPVSEAISSILALFAGTPTMTFVDAPPVANPTREQIKAALDVQDAEAAVADEPKEAKATRTRRPRTAPDAAPVVEHQINMATGEVTEKPAAEATAEPRRRTRVTAEPAVETVKTISDADLAKACSDAAAIVGVEVVQAVIADFHVKSMQDLAADVREKFLAELKDEIDLAKAELAASK